MITFEQIILQDFRSFAGKHTVPLGKKGLFLVKGRNLDTAGESGAGKSTIFIAIGFALGCSPFSGKDLTNWYSDKTQIVLSITVDDKKVDVYRGAINKIVHEDREITGAKQIEAELDAIFGIDANQRASVLYKDQGLGDYFLNKTNAEKRDFIVSVLGIDEFEKQIALVNQEVSQKTTKQGYIANESEALACYLVKEKEKLTALRAPVKVESDLTLPTRIKDNEDMIASLSSQLDILEEEEKEELKTIKEAFSFFQSKIASCLKDDRVLDIENSILQAEANKAVFVEKSTSLAKQISEGKLNAHKRAVLERSKNELLKFLETTDVSTCPTCRQMWDSQPLITAKKEELTLTEAQLAESPVVDLDELVLLEKDAKAMLRNEDKRIGDLRVAKVELIEQLQSTLLAQVRVLQNSPTRNSEPIKAIKDELVGLGRAKTIFAWEQTNALFRQNEYDKAHAVYEANKRNAEVQVTTLEQKKRDIDTENTNLLKSIAFLNEKVEFTKGFLYNIFHDMLEELTLETNAILSKIPNVAHVTVSFTSERETKKGDIKQELVAKINVNGSERPLKSGCSGGMISAVQLATDLALRKLLSRRTQKDWGILMIDEQFGGLDIVSKTSCMEVLKDFSQSCLVMVIDHHTEINEYSDQIIEVEYQNGRSYIA